MKRICAAIDVSPSAEKIAEKAYDLAKKMEAELILTHCFDDSLRYNYSYDPIMGYSGQLISADITKIDDYKGEIQDFLNKTKLHLGDENVKTKVLTGKIDKAILHFAKEEQVDLIVMGTHSHNLLEDLFIGSTAKKVVGQSSIPVLVIPISS